MNKDIEMASISSTTSSQHMMDVDRTPPSDPRLRFLDIEDQEFLFTEEDFNLLMDIVEGDLGVIN